MNQIPIPNTQIIITVEQGHLTIHTTPSNAAWLNLFMDKAKLHLLAGGAVDGIIQQPVKLTPALHVPTPQEAALVGNGNGR